MASDSLVRKLHLASAFVVPAVAIVHGNESQRITGGVNESVVGQFDLQLIKPVDLEGGNRQWIGKCTYQNHRECGNSF